MPYKLTDKWVAVSPKGQVVSVHGEPALYDTEARAARSGQAVPATDLLSLRYFIDYEGALQARLVERGAGNSARDAVRNKIRDTKKGIRHHQRCIRELKAQLHKLARTIGRGK